MIVAGLLCAAYLIGSFPTSLILARYLKGIDLRAWGSGNLGATNLYRAAGFGPASVCMLVDVSKGFGPAWFFPGLDRVDAPQLALAYGVAAVAGHIAPLWLRFRGGKGVATGAGAYLALAPAAVGLVFAGWLVVVLLVRIVSVASLFAASILPLVLLLVGHGFDFVFWTSLPLAALVWYTRTVPTSGGWRGGKSHASHGVPVRRRPSRTRPVANRRAEPSGLWVERR